MIDPQELRKEILDSLNLPSRDFPPLIDAIIAEACEQTAKYNSGPIDAKIRMTAMGHIAVAKAWLSETVSNVLLSENADMVTLNYRGKSYEIRRDHPWIFLKS